MSTRLYALLLEYGELYLPVWGGEGLVEEATSYSHTWIDQKFSTLRVSLLTDS